MQEVIDFTAALHLAAKALQFYTAEHPRGAEALMVLDRAANALVAQRPRVSIVATKGALLVDGAPLASEAARNKAHVTALARELEARQFGGIILMQGVTYRELVELVRLFVMKPQQVRDAGGAEEIFRRADVIHVRISHVRYEAITEGEEVVWSQTARRAEQFAGFESADGLPALLKKFLLTQNAAASGENVPELEGLGEKADEIAAKMPDKVRDALMQAIAGVQPEVQLALLMNIASLPEGALRNVLQPAAREVMQTSASDTDALAHLIGQTSLDASGIELLRGRLETLGISREQLDDVMNVIGWDKLSIAEKIEKLLTGGRIFDFPREKLVVFIRDLVEQGRFDDAFRLLDAYARGLEQDAFTVRQNVIDTFGQVAPLIDTPGVNPQIEQLLTRAILNHFVKESDARMCATVANAVASLCTALASAGRADVALRTLTRLEVATNVAAPEAAVRKSYECLGAAFAEPRRAAKLVNQIFVADAETFGKAVAPMVAQLGGALVPVLIETLTNEEDRNRRGRLVRTIKSIGRPAYPSLLEALHAPAWYVVRNTLNILGDIGEHDHASAIGTKMEHSDARVRRAAARALGKIGGAESEMLLVEALGERDTETLTEILLALASMKAQRAVPALSEMARSRSLPAEVRETAITTLGSIGSDLAVPALGEIMRPRGLFVREPLQTRVAAARALAAIATPEALTTLRNAVAAESDRNVRAAFAGIGPA
jgi:HEAT repeat protein